MRREVWKCDGCDTTTVDLAMPARLWIGEYKNPKRPFGHMKWEAEYHLCTVCVRKWRDKLKKKMGEGTKEEEPL